MDDQLQDIVSQLSYTQPQHPKPTMMRMEEYIDFINFLKSNPKQQKAVLEALRVFNKAYKKIVRDLDLQLQQIYPRKK
jgi:hypothetical protein